MSIHRRIVRLPGRDDERRTGRSWRLGTGTLACPSCDAPVAIAPAPLGPSAALGCPFCLHQGRVRDFLSLAEPARPARVSVTIFKRA